jgi:hypothetical protein
MPEQTYNIGYRPNDFFYRPENVDLEATIPFDKSNLVLWAKSKDISNNIPSNIINDIFDINVTKVVKTNKNSFIDDYLPGNIIIDKKFSNFYPRRIDMTSPLNADTLIARSMTKGDVIVTSGKSANNKFPEMNLNIKQGSNFEYKTNVFGEIQSDISLNIDISGGDVPFPEPNQSTSYISLNTANPRCKYQNKCTQPHWYYDGGCERQTIVNKSDGTTYCKCVCTGNKKLGTPGDIGTTLDPTGHSHCSPFIINESTNSDIYYQSKIAALLNNLKVNFTHPSSSNFGKDMSNNLTFDYHPNYKLALSNNDYNIRKTLYDYYVALIDNKEYQEKIKKNSTLDTTASQALVDANVKYKKEYLHLFNIFSGILFVSGYIYVMNKSK